jgi:hypothetical protein
MRIILDGLIKVNIKITPYYLVLEGLFDKTIPHLETGFDDCEICYLGSDDMKTIAAIPERDINEKTLLRWLNEGKKCLGFKRGSELAAFTWCDLDECNAEFRRFPLAPDEAYLFDAYTMMNFRGRGIAPYVRYQLYKELLKLNRTRLYSISNYYNQQSINFKKKLNAKTIDLALHISIFNKWEFSRILRKYKI